MVAYKARTRVSPIKLDQTINYKDINLLKTFSYRTRENFTSS
jgi:ribosomal protein S18